MPKIPLSKPSISELERDYVNRVMDSGRLALGPFQDEFEARFASICGVRHAIAVNSGTAALHLIVRAMGIGPGDEIITTPYSFIASANAALFEGASPVFVDIEADTFNIDTSQIEAAITPATRAILAVDVFGAPANWTELRRIADKHELLLIDDACEALGASVDGKPVGSLGDAAAFGFYPNKQITTGEGGCITTDSDEINRLCRSMRNQGRIDDRFMEHGRLGFNYRLPELSAAVGCAQLERLPLLLESRKQIAGWYGTYLTRAACRLPSDSPGRSWFVYVVEISDDYPANTRDDLIKSLSASGVQSAPYFPSIHTQPFYRERFGYTVGDFPRTERAAAHTIALPFFPDLTEEQVQFVAKAITSHIPRL